MKISQLILGLVIGTSVTALTWSASASDVARLGTDLLPTGGERAGNKEGTIPAFEGEDQPLPGWTWGKYREEFWRHKDEKSLFEINSSNVEKYADQLSPGQIQMIKQLNGYSLPVYPTHRNCTVPDFVAKNTAETALKSAISKKDGWSLEHEQLGATDTKPNPTVRHPRGKVFGACGRNSPRMRRVGQTFPRTSRRSCR